MIEGAEGNDCAGVYMMFPSTIVEVNPYSTSVTRVIPTGLETTRLMVCNWSPNDSWRGDPEENPGYDPATGVSRSENWTVHPLKTEDFFAEDIWICEAIRKNLHSPAFEVGALAEGAGAEAPLTFFQGAVSDRLGGPRAASE